MSNHEIEISIPLKSEEITPSLTVAKKGGTFIFKSIFPKNKDTREGIYAKMQKELQIEGEKEGATVESPVKFKDAVIGDKSFGLIDKNGNLCSLIFQRGIMVFKLDNRQGKDIREVASGIDRQWQKAGRPRK